MLIKHYTIPVFIPELACPFQCVFCNQKKITGHIHIPDVDEIKHTIKEYLSTFKEKKRIVEVGFFGGSFTGIPYNQQKKYLEVVQPFLKSGEINGLRLSTRPDYIDNEILGMLSDYGVTTIELGAQSFSNDVLKKSKRGHTVEQIEKASELIKLFNINLGLQIMTGLPGDSIESTVFSAQRVIDLNAIDTRIYPVVVIKDTILHRWYETGKYIPLTLQQAVNRVKQIIPLFEQNNVNIIRVGLHPSDGLLTGKELIDGPFHPAFRELVYTELWNDILKNIYPEKGKNIVIAVPGKEMNFAIGHNSKNRKMLEKKYRQVKFTIDNSLMGRKFFSKIDF